MTKTPNISSASLRSSSWKTRLCSSKFQRSNQLQTNINEKHHASKKSFKSQIGISSKKSIQCKGCKSTFRIYSDISSFMNRHVLSNDKCPNAYPKCLPPCNKIFYDQKNLISHQQRSPKDSTCYKVYMQSFVNKKFMSTEVEIPIMTIPGNSPIDIPAHLEPFHKIERNFMFTKQTVDYSAFYPSMAFINKSIHFTKPTLPINFYGHAIMDPKQLEKKKGNYFHFFSFGCK